MIQRTYIYTTHSHPEAKDPADQLELVREGFSLLAFLFHALWFLYHRLWVPALVVFVLFVLLVFVGKTYELSPVTVGSLQVLLQLLVGFMACDCKRWVLARRGYRMTGVVVADSELAAHQRYFDRMA